MHLSRFEPQFLTRTGPDFVVTGDFDAADGIQFQCPFCRPFRRRHTVVLVKLHGLIDFAGSGMQDLSVISAQSTVNWAVGCGELSIRRGKVSF